MHNASLLKGVDIGLLGQPVILREYQAGLKIPTVIQVGEMSAGVRMVLEHHDMEGY